MLIQKEEVSIQLCRFEISVQFRIKKYFLQGKEFCISTL